jgi:hypothetical protein
VVLNEEDFLTKRVERVELAAIEACGAGERGMNVGESWPGSMSGPAMLRQYEEVSAGISHLREEVDVPAGGGVTGNQDLAMKKDP